jgi:hypothetical protein
MSTRFKLAPVVVAEIDPPVGVVLDHKREKPSVRLGAVTLPLFAGVLSPGTTRPFCAVPRTSVAHIASG